MKSLRSFLDRIKPTFDKGGKLQMFHSSFEAFESFLFVPDRVTTRGSHVRDSIDLKRTMTVVIIALMPALLFGMWNVGFQHTVAFGLKDWTFWQVFGFGALRVMPIVIVSYVVGLGIEFAFAQVRHHEVNEGFLVTGMLIPLVMPVDVPLWMVGLATAFAVIIGKEVFGGTGMNVFNPALLARAFLFFAYPSKMSGEVVWIAGVGENAKNLVDGFSGATPLAVAATGVGETAHSMNVDQLMSHMPSASDMFMGFIPGSIGETSTLAILIGAIILIATGVGSWKIIVATVAGGLGMGLLLNWAGVNPYMQLPAYYHLIMGGFAFGAVFMATDPVTGSQTETGKWIYGALIGVMAVLIRVLNPAYPEGMMLAILLMNTFAPLIDYYVVQSNVKRRLRRAKVTA